MTSRHNTTSPVDLFAFDSDHLLQFCAKFSRTPIDDQTEAILEIKLKDLEARWTRLDGTYERVMLYPDESVDSEIKEQIKKEYGACEDAYYNCSAQILEFMKAYRLETFGNPGFQSTSRHGQAAQASNQGIVSNDSYNCLKLPPCDTEVFKGSYEQWPSFRDMFTAVYINHSKLSPVTKLYHLRNKTRGEAGAIVKRYPLSHDNFELAWDALKSRYENKRVLVDNQIKILFDIPAAKVENTESIKRIQSSVNDSLATLRTLGIEVESWDPILIRLISTKLPEHTLSLWEQSLKSPRELPKWTQMSQFLIDRYETLERVSSIRTTKDMFNLSTSSQPNIQTYMSHENLSTNACKLCNENNSLRTCPKFQEFTVQQRIDYVFKNKFCNNCLAISHIRKSCTSKHTCFYCKKQHHTLLHVRHNSTDQTQKSENTLTGKPSYDAQSSSHKNFFISNHSDSANTRKELPQSSKQVQSNCATSNENILLRTALTQIEHQGQLFTIRALIDPGSQRTFLTERIRNRLQLPYRKAHFDIVGIGGQTQTANKECELVLYAKRYNLRVPIKAIVLPKVTKRLPLCTFEVPASTQLLELDLADPTFNRSSQVDLILGNDYEQLLNIEGIKKNICGQASAYNTIFGWVLSGPMQTQTVQSFTTSVQSSEIADLNLMLRKFWEQEEVPIANPSSVEDEYCEEFYTRTTTRDENGRYVVRLPFKADFPEHVFLGSSRFIALSQYSRMEKTLAKNPDLQSQYNAVLNEYLTLDHMEETCSHEISVQGKYNSYYLPHHAVVRPEHKSTKVRVVFNASRKTKSQFSLNDVLYTGPTLQNDLMAILLNWRKYKFVFNGDIQKMYRQVLIHPHDRGFQRILFNTAPDKPIKDYQLKTVTFGVNCAPYLAIRTLLQLATDSELIYPKAASILRTETYVDDILSGGYSIEETLAAQTQLIQALSSSGFPSKKVTANHPRLLAHLPKEDLYDSEFLRFHEISSTKTLGIRWNALEDSFTYSFEPIEQSAQTTKRKILSTVAKLFDPAGWLAPVVIRAKILMQQLWLEGLQWDEDVSPDFLQKWNDLVQDFSQVETISIPRWLQYEPTCTIQIHGFSDSSKSAYCATVYIRCQTSTQTTFSNLLVAKSKVAPIKTVSLPRLELSGAVLLANLVNYVKSTLKLNPNGTYLWTDSSIVLGWLSKLPSSWETYVANRVAQIQLLVPDATWQYVPTHHNPADLGTRGSKPPDLAQNTQWWHGPPWLIKPPSEWPKRNPLKNEENTKGVLTLHAEVHEEDQLNRFSSFSRALRVLSYVFRFFNNSLSKIAKTGHHANQDQLTQDEIRFVKRRLITLAQRTFYTQEYHCLLNSKSIPNNSSLKTLNPFLDSDSIMRVNGRLSQSSLPYGERYPIILPGNSRFCHLYLTHLHQFLCHAECSQMCRMVQTEFFISRLKPRVKSIIHHCKTCIIFKQRPFSQIMAPLPPERCNFSLPFQITGIDFAGPFDIKTSLLRKSPSVKGYASVFVCFSTKAIHLEPCSELSSAAFQAAFARFVGRRGLPQRVVTDNGRNFLGCSKVLERQFTAFVNDTAQDIAQKYLTHGFEWKFIPPHAPHMGGLWEAAVKSFKYHLKRIAGAQKFTFEEFATILARIEGILNSRPISALSEDPADLSALTPGHFLRGAPLVAFPEQNFESMSLINRWEKLKAIQHQFTIRWKQEYLKSLHKRYKWKNSATNIQTGDLVVVIDDLQPPHEWRLGRILGTHPGPDKNVRIVDVRTATGVITRPITKLCYLPLMNYDNSKPNRRLTATRHTRSHSKTSLRLRGDENVYKCVLCKTYHSLRFCRKFLSMDVEAREELVDQYRLCSNCLARSHDLRTCSSLDTCKKCRKYHHTLLHRKPVRPKRVKSISTQQLRKQKQQQRQNQQKKRQPTSKQQRGQQQKASSSTPEVNPDAKLIAEAIRSLAQVLCASGSSPSVA